MLLEQAAKFWKVFTYDSRPICTQIYVSDFTERQVSNFIIVLWSLKHVCLSVNGRALHVKYFWKACCLHFYCFRVFMCSMFGSSINQPCCSVIWLSFLIYVKFTETPYLHYLFVTFQNDGICQVSQYGDIIECICPEGVYGQSCEYQVDDCAISPCLHGGICVDHTNSFTCNCTSTGYETKDETQVYYY